MNNDRDRPLSGSDEDATLARLQRVALQLIRNRGYEATTLDDVAEALQVPAGVVSQHFATMEALVLYDTLAPPTIDAVHALLPDASPATALRVALHQVLDHLSVDEIDDLRYRVALIAAKPRLRSSMTRSVLELSARLPETAMTSDRGIRLVTAALTAGLARRSGASEMALDARQLVAEALVPLRQRLDL